MSRITSTVLGLSVLLVTAFPIVATPQDRRARSVEETEIELRSLISKAPSFETSHSTEPILQISLVVLPESEPPVWACVRCESFSDCQGHVYQLKKPLTEIAADIFLCCREDPIEQLTAKLRNLTSRRAIKSFTVPGGPTGTLVIPFGPQALSLHRDEVRIEFSSMDVWWNFRYAVTDYTDPRTHPNEELGNLVKALLESDLQTGRCQDLEH